MGMRPTCDNGCEEYWQGYWAGAFAENMGLLDAAMDRLKDVQELADKWQALAMDYKRDLHEARGTSDEYKELFRRTIGLHDQSVRDE